MGVKFRSIELTSGDVITVVDGITVLVGPNNSGKSLTLRELFDFFSRGPIPTSPNLVVNNANIEYLGTKEEFF